MVDKNRASALNWNHMGTFYNPRTRHTEEDNIVNEMTYQGILSEVLIEKYFSRIRNREKPSKE